MRVIYNISALVGGSGIGNTACHAVKEVDKSGSLYKLICLDNKNIGIEKEKITNFRALKYILWYPLKGIQKYIVHGFNPYLILDPIYDFLASLRIKEGDLFHGWRSHSYRCIKKAKSLGIKTIVENASSHPLYSSRVVEEEYRKYGIKFKAFTRRQLKLALEELNLADYVLIPSDFVEKTFIDANFSKNKLIKIPFGVDLEKFKFKKQKEDNKFRCIFVGSLQLRKGFQYLLEAWKELKLKNAELVLVGNVWPESQEVVSKYRNDSSIKFVGFANPTDYFKKSDVFVFPTIEEGSALVNYEAMASGLPVITTFNSGTVARHGKDGFIIPIRDIVALKKKILFFYNNPREIERMGMNARKNIENYTWEKYGQRLIAAYKKVLSKK
jgi:glycosyltransferase involved in cell wall biosynthesis